ncbi:unnamed protein product, partial [Brassica rapa subsp. trilocularis]
MAPLVSGPASLPRPPSDPPDPKLKVALPSNPPDPPVPPDPPPDTLSFMGLLQLYDLWVTLTLSIYCSMKASFHLCSNGFCND